MNGLAENDQRLAAKPSEDDAAKASARATARASQPDCDLAHNRPERLATRARPT